MVTPLADVRPIRGRGHEATRLGLLLPGFESLVTWSDYRLGPFKEGPSVQTSAPIIIAKATADDLRAGGRFPSAVYEANAEPGALQLTGVLLGSARHQTYLSYYLPAVLVLYFQLMGVVPVYRYTTSLSLEYRLLGPDGGVIWTAVYSRAIESSERGMNRRASDENQREMQAVLRLITDALGHDLETHFATRSGG